MLGIVFLILIGCIGLAIDTGRAMVVKARLTNALDAAGLAVGARAATTDFTADAKNYVAANFKANYAAATVTKVTATANSDKTVISLTATATMPTAFMKLFGIKSVTVNAASEVTRASTGLEVVMVLDNTGSMEQSGSMPGLRTAATNLVNFLFEGASASDNLYVGLVPFSQAVNIGVGTAPWLVMTGGGYYPSKWTGCVEERGSNLDQTDDPPSASPAKYNFRTYFNPHSARNVWLPSPYTIDYSGLEQTGPGAFCPSGVTPMTDAKSTVLAGIANMKSGGATLINVGAVWGWRMLAPSWRGLWGGRMGQLKLPLDYNSKNMTKAVVLMTDGDNSVTAADYMAYGMLSEGRLGSTTNPAIAEQEANRRLSVVCSGMKSKGVVIYTISFNTLVNSDTENCFNLARLAPAISSKLRIRRR